MTVQTTTATEAVTYPLFSDAAAGTAHLRAYPDDCERSRRADIASVARELWAQGRNVIVAATNAPDMVAAIGLGWREPRLHLSSPRRLLEVTAELYEAWASGAGTVAVVIEDWMSLRTGAGRGHDDRIGADWVEAVRTGDIDTVESLTGLSYSGYLGDATAPAPAPTTVWLATRVRRGAGAVSTRHLMGGVALIARCHTVTVIDVDRQPGSSMIGGHATLLKHPAGIYGHQVRLSRHLSDGLWTPVI